MPNLKPPFKLHGFGLVAVEVKSWCTGFGIKWTHTHTRTVWYTFCLCFRFTCFSHFCICVPFFFNVFTGAVLFAPDGCSQLSPVHSDPVHFPVCACVRVCDASLHKLMFSLLLKTCTAGFVFKLSSALVTTERERERVALGILEEPMQDS